MKFPFLVSILACVDQSSILSIDTLEPVMETIGMCGYQKPTLIQSCSWPILLSGLDLIGIALTGSGKTLAFMLPAIIHASHQEFVRPGDGPIVLIMAPTRELAQQISTVAQQFGQLAQCRTTVIFGGASKDPQRQTLLSGSSLRQAEDCVF
jgi:superfamily II DNA/RNA helicase